MTMETSTVTYLNELISSKCSDWKVPGMALVMARDGNPIYYHMHGFRDVQRALPVTENTVFGVASVTKSMTALAIIQAQDQGRLSVHDAAVRWLPELRDIHNEWMQHVTIHHLLTHTAGFPGMAALFRARAKSIQDDPDWRITKGDMPNPFDVNPIHNFVELMEVMKELDFGFLGTPGTVFNYSNEGFALLQGILERATNQGFLEFVREHIQGPLHIENSVFRTEDLKQLPEVTELYASRIIDGERTVFHSPAWWDVGDVYANGSLKASVSDLLRYMEVYRKSGVVDGQRLVSEASLRQMTTPHVVLPTGHSYGYGLHVDNHHGLKVLAHSGGIKGVSADIVIAPEMGITVAAIANIAGVPVSQLTMAALNGALGLQLDAPTIQYPGYKLADEDANFQKYIGKYQSGEGGKAEVYAAVGKLHVTMAGQTTPMRPFAEDGFVDASGTWAIRFMRGDDGKVSGMFSGVRVLQKR